MMDSMMDNNPRANLNNNPTDNNSRANLKCFFKDGAISSGDSEVKEAASRYFC
jgi:hypothetical protein